MLFTALLPYVVGITCLIGAIVVAFPLYEAISSTKGVVNGMDEDTVGVIVWFVCAWFLALCVVWILS